MTNAELIARWREYRAWPMEESTCGTLGDVLADALERTERERDESVAREAAMQEALKKIMRNNSGCTDAGCDGYGDERQHTNACPQFFREIATAALATPSPATERLLAQVKAADMLYVALGKGSISARHGASGKEIFTALEAYRAAKEG